jgi:hypothetical protein
LRWVVHGVVPGPAIQFGGMVAAAISGNLGAPEYSRPRKSGTGMMRIRVNGHNPTPTWSITVIQKNDLISCNPEDR